MLVTFFAIIAVLIFSPFDRQWALVVSLWEGEAD